MVGDGGRHDDKELLSLVVGVAVCVGEEERRRGGEEERRDGGTHGDDDKELLSLFPPQPLPLASLPLPLRPFPLSFGPVCLPLPAASQSVPGNS